MRSATIGSLALMALVAIPSIAACKLVTGIDDIEASAGVTASTSSGAPIPDGGGGFGGGDTCVADIANDGQNCGRCGHDCLGGACMGGVCQPAFVAPSVPPCVIAVNPYDVTSPVYWVNQGSKELWTAADGAAPVHITTLSGGDLARMSLFAGDGANGFTAYLYLTLSSSPGPSRLARVKVTPPYASELYSGSWSGLWAVTTDGASVYATTDEGVVRASLFNLTSAKLFYSAPAPDQAPNDIKVDNADVYWIANHQILRLSVSPSPGAVPDVLLDGEEGMQVLAVDGTDVYWGGSKGLRRKSKSDPNAAIQTLRADLTPALALIVDDTSVYWISPDNVLHAIRKDGQGSLLTLSAGAGASLGVTPNAIYFCNDSSVYRLAK